jgi:conjugal transfer ATP-binding protein TraC
MKKTPRVPLSTLADLLAPTAVAVHRDALEVDDTWFVTLAVTAYPRSLEDGWFARIIDTEEPVEVSLYLEPQDSTAIVRQLSRRLTQLRASQAIDQRTGRIGDAARNVASADVERTRDAVARGTEHLFSVGLYLRVSGVSAEEVQARARRVMATLENAQLEARPATFEQDLGWLATQPWQVDRWMRRRVLDTRTLAALFPFTSRGISMHQGPVYGLVPNGTLVMLDPFASAMENANHTVFAKSGAGKSFLCKVTALRHMLFGTDVIIIDPEGEYRPLCQQVQGQYLSLAPGSGQSLNPFDLPQALAGEKIGDVLATKVQSLHALLELMLADRGPRGAATLTQQERSLLDHALYDTYLRAGITSDRATHDRPPPLLRDLYAVLVSGVSGPDESHLATRLRRYVEGSLAGLFESQTNVALDNRLTVFGLQDLHSELRPLGLFLITDFVESRMRAERRPRLLYIDEAWMLMQFPEGAAYLASLARRARKRYLGLVTITQNVEDFLHLEAGRTVLAQSGITILLLQDSSTISTVVDTFGLTPSQRNYLLSCRKGEGLLYARGSHTPLLVVASEQEYQMATTDPQDLARQAQMATQHMEEEIDEAVQYNGQRPHGPARRRSHHGLRGRGGAPDPDAGSSGDARDSGR